MATKTFTREYLLEELDLPYGCEGGKIISNEIVDQGRWTTMHNIIFQLKGQPEDEAYSVCYERGSTEHQEVAPWEDQDEVECAIVHRTTKTIEVWE